MHSQSQPSRTSRKLKVQQIVHLPNFERANPGADPNQEEVYRFTARVPFQGKVWGSGAMESEPAQVGKLPLQT